MLRVVVLAALACFNLASSASAGTVIVPYSGQLAENGAPVTGSRFMRFSLYNDADAGAPIAVQQESVQVVNGVFHVQLHWDEVVWISDTPFFLGIAVGALEFPVRTPIGTTPFAVNALQARRAARADSADVLRRPAPLPGVAWTDPILNVSVGTSSFTLLESLTLTAPADGYLIVQTAGYGGSNGQSRLDFRISTSADPEQGSHFDTSVANPGSPYAYPVLAPIGLSGAFQVMKGPSVVYLFVRRAYCNESYNCSSIADAVRLIATWIPNRY